MTDQNITPHFGRVLTAMVTPFDADGNIDYAEAAGLARYLVQNGSEGLVIAGTTGESATLNTDEKLRLFKAVKEAVGKDAKVLAGTGSYNTAETIVLSREAQHIGVDGLLIVTPYYNKPSQEGIYQHYKAIAEATTLPIMLYNVPGRTNLNMEASTTLRLAQIPNIVAIKEASKDLEQIGDIILDAPGNFQVYSGSDEVNLPVLAIGGVGVVSVISHVAGLDLKRAHDAFFSGDLATAQKLFLKTLPLTKAMFSVPSPAPTKAALVMLGVIQTSVLRLPMVEATEAQRGAILAGLQNYGLLGG
jgi:4-hydroxy-tetrahydrodipicolinate synthase